MDSNIPWIEEFPELFGRKFDSGKIRFDLIPEEAEEALAKVLTYGANKYAPDDWKKVEDAEDRYYAALRRHLHAMRDGEKFDAESGLPHSWHALANMAFLVWLEARDG